MNFHKKVALQQYSYQCVNEPNKSYNCSHGLCRQKNNCYIYHVILPAEDEKQNM